MKHRQSNYEGSFSFKVMSWPYKPASNLHETVTLCLHHSSIGSIDRVQKKEKATRDKLKLQARLRSQKRLSKNRASPIACDHLSVSRTKPSWQHSPSHTSYKGSRNLPMWLGTIVRRRGICAMNISSKQQIHVGHLGLKYFNRDSFSYKWLIRGLTLRRFACGSVGPRKPSPSSPSSAIGGRLPMLL